MNFKLFTRTILLFLTMFLLAGHSLADDVVAVVNGHKIKKSQLDLHIKLLETVTKQKVINKSEALADLVDREIIHQEVTKKKINKDPELAYIAEFQTRELFSKALFKKVLGSKPITDAEIKKLYDEKIKNLDLKEYKISHILFKASDPDGENKAKAAIAELDKGAKFEDVAKAKSQDPSANKGGDIGWLNLAQLRGYPSLAQAVTEMSNGSYSKTPIKTKAGWHVVKLVDTRKKEPPSLEQATPQLRLVIQQKRVEDYVKSLRKKSKIDIKMKK